MISTVETAFDETTLVLISICSTSMNNATLENKLQKI